MKKIFITTAIDYINAAPHIGHAYEKIAADILARYYRNLKDNVNFLTGTDEHGQKVAQAAEKQQLAPQKYADGISQKYQETWKRLEVKYDNFARTTSLEHEKFVQDFLQKLFDKGEIYKDKYEGLYCVGCEEYKNKEELLNGDICPNHQKPCEKITEEIYFFKLSKYQNQLLDTIKNNQLLIEPEIRRNEIIQFLSKEPLKDLAISRSKVSWGIPLPWDKTQTIYVWVDALLNYISFSQGFWPPEVQLIGKDIFRFHAIIWPALLIASDMKLPKKLFIHGFLTVDSQKISKTIGNVIDPIKIIDKYGVDTLRYFLFREIPFGQDGDFSEKRLAERYQSDLANDLGNLLQRVLVMAEKYEIEWEYQTSKKQYPKINQDIEALRFSFALEKIWQIINNQNQKIDQEKPWEIAKTNPEKLFELILELLEKLSDIAALISPFMPETSEKIIAQLKSRKPEVLFPKQ